MEAKTYIDKLQLEAHPEGGYYKEIYRNPATVELPEGGGTRNLATSIYYLLEGHDKSHFHQLKSDEMWYYHAGCAITIHVFEKGLYRKEVLGLDLDSGELPQVLLPAGSIFAAQPLNFKSFTLLGCMVNPGFDFKDFRMMSKEELLKEYPDQEEIISEFTVE